MTFVTERRSEQVSDGIGHLREARRDAWGTGHLGEYRQELCGGASREGKEGIWRTGR